MWNSIWRKGWVEVWQWLCYAIDNRLSSHTDNLKNNYLILGEEDTFGINESFGVSAWKFSLNFSRSNSKVCLG